MAGASPGRLPGKTALITGGGRGIGRGIALRFAREGARVAIAQRDVASAEATAREIAAAGGDVLALSGTDVSRPEQVARVVDATVERYGQIDILVNNAGLAGPN